MSNVYQSMLELYQFEECPYSRNVRTKMTDLGLTYIIHNVPRERELRDELERVSEQRFVPVLVDKEKNVMIADDDEKICEYLEREYSKKG